MPFETLTGIVQSIDRSTNTCLVQVGLDTVGGFLIQRPTIPVTYRGSPPPPLSYVDIRQKETGVWRLEGDVSNRSGTIHDDFLYVGALAGGELPCDTNWQDINNTGPGTIGNSVVADTFGAVFISTPAVANASEAIAKGIDAVSIKNPIWFSAKVETVEVASTSIWVGLGGSIGDIHQGAPADNAVWAFDTGISTTESRLRVMRSGTATSLSVPFVPAVDTFFIIDLILVESEFAALWIDGNGPYVATTNVPAWSVTSLTPFVSVWTYVAATRTIRADWVHLESLTPVAHPLRDLILPESAIVG